MKLWLRIYSSSIIYHNFDFVSIYKLSASIVLFKDILYRQKVLKYIITIPGAELFSRGHIVLSSAKQTLKT